MHENNNSYPQPETYTKTDKLRDVLYNIYVLLLFCFLKLISVYNLYKNNNSNQKGKH